MDAFSDMRTQPYIIDSDIIYKHLREMSEKDRGQLAADHHTKAYYGGLPSLLWVDYHGVSSNADTLLNYLNDAGRLGLNTSMYRIEQIERDINRMRQLDFSDGNSINSVIARLEYNLTRAYLRYTSGQYFGLVNPAVVLNRFDVKEEDTLKVTYKRLYDVKLRQPDNAFFNRAVTMIRKDSVPSFLHEVQPSGNLYSLLVERLQAAATDRERKKIICNIERCRWRQYDYPYMHSKYVAVNIPSFSLKAVDGDSTLFMRVIVGALKTKSPILTSRVMRMDVNPQWIVPKSIAKGIVNSTGYLQREHMFIYDKKHGRVGYEEASYTKIMEGQQYIIQEGGQGNSLGRIIFRFQNNFSVYLHDTSSPWLFQRDTRAMSHGCIRVEKPYELAEFLLENKDELTLGKIKYSMSADIGGDKDADEKKRTSIDRNKLIRMVKVEPEIPLFIVYYTYYTDKGGRLSEYNDIYGYDEVIIDKLTPYIKL